jgi:hypothetical protein
MIADVLLLVGFVGCLALMIATAFFVGMHLIYAVWDLPDSKNPW